MQKQKMAPAKAKLVIIAALLCPVGALAQSGAGSAGGTAAGSSMSSPSTTGIASDQARISPPGTNSLGTANSSGEPAGTTVGANMRDNARIDAEIRNENSQIDSKINNICRGC